jgi:hypothetical protein
VNTQADEILVRNGAMSPDTMAMRANLDPDDERQKADANPSPQVLNALGVGDTRPGQPGISGKTTSRGVPAGKEPGPSVNPMRAEEGMLESSYEPQSKDKPTQEDMAMASVLLPGEWLTQTKTEIMGLPINGTNPRDNGVRVEYEPGIGGVYLGIVDNQKVWAVDASAFMVKYGLPDFVVAGNSERCPMIPAGVILVDWAYSPADLRHDVYHEIIEYKLMSVGKWAYARAHKIANYFEMQFLLELRPELQGLRP